MKVKKNINNLRYTLGSEKLMDLHAWKRTHQISSPTGVSSTQNSNLQTPSHDYGKPLNFNTLANVSDMESPCNVNILNKSGYKR